MQVQIHLYNQSNPIVLEHVTNAYQKGDFYCVMFASKLVQKFPIQHIFRIIETP